MAYTPIISIEDLHTNIYPEILDEISRSNDSILNTAIANGISEVKIYLSRYDLTQLFGDQTEDIAATFTDEYLSSLVKDVICWHVIRLSNTNIQYDHIRTCYEDAIKSLKSIMKGEADPRWPYQDTTGLTTPPGISVSISSHPRRNNRY